jgi:hypothetical protein
MYNTYIKNRFSYEIPKGNTRVKCHDMDSGLEKCKLNKKLKDCTLRAFQLLV